MKKYAFLAAMLCALPLWGCAMDELPEPDYTLPPEETNPEFDAETQPVTSAAETRSAAEINSIVDDLLSHTPNRPESGQSDIAVQTPEAPPESHADEAHAPAPDTSDFWWAWSTGVREEVAIADYLQQHTFETPDPDSDVPIYMPARIRDIPNVAAQYPELADQPVREISRSGFSGADYAHRIVLPETVIFFGSHAFSQSSVREFAHHAEEITMEEGCFSDCEQLKTVTFSSDPVRLGDYCFENSAVTEVTGEDCNLITNRFCFLNLPELERVSLSGDIQLGDYAFIHSAHACTVELSGGGITLGTYAFADSGIESLEIGECQRCAIGEDGFSRCKDLKSVTLGEGVAQIDSYAFFSCPSLTTVRLPKSLKQIGADVFGNCSSDLMIEVPEYSYAAAYCKENGLNYRTVS